MFGNIGARTVAVLLIMLPPIFGGAVPALAQYQVNMSAIDPAEPSSQTPTAGEPFGLNAVPVTSGGVATKWSGVVADIRAESAILAECRDDASRCPPAAQKFLAVIADGRARSGRARFGVINRAINLAIKPTSDMEQWGEPDRWSTPLVTLATGRGDCEDYAIAKYVALREAGIPEGEVRLVIVHDLAVGEDHAVVAAYLEGKWIMLDNRRLVMVEDVEMSGVVPLFVLDHEGVKQFTRTMIADAPAIMAPGEAAAAAPGSLGF